MIDQCDLSERRACRLVGLSRDSFRHPPRGRSEDQRLERQDRGNRPWASASRLPASERVPLQLAQNVNEVWSMDFVSDSLANGRRIKCMTGADDFSHECVDIAVDWGISGEYVTRILDRAAIFCGYPQAVRTDIGLEFTSRAFMVWAHSHGVRHILIQPGRLMQNGYIESFNGKFRDECLNEQWFQTLHQARSAITVWRQDYNEVRPHSSRVRIPPARFAELHPNQPLRRSINLASRGFLNLIGTSVGGRSRGRANGHGFADAMAHKPGGLV